jgi:plastocyanin
MTALRLHLVALAAGLALSLAACGGSSTAARSSSSARTNSSSRSAPARATAQSGTVDVSIRNYGFHSAASTVKPGTKLIFTNHDQTAHTATASGGGFDTGAIAPGSSRTVVITRPGVYTYYCQFHPFMRATVIVK